MKKSKLWIQTLCVLLFVSGSVLAQQQPPLSPDEERDILRALIDRDAFAAQLREVQQQLQFADEQIRLAGDRLRLEREQRLGEKNLHLAALQALAEYRTVRRARFWKIITLGIVKDKRDKILEAQILALQEEISTWKP